MKKINLKRLSNKATGFTLIEVMIAVVVFSFGLLGVAGVMTVSVKNNHNGYMRSQATILAQSVVDMMRRNHFAVWQNAYNGTFSGQTDIRSICTGASCSCTQIANRDTTIWGSMISQSLPNSQGVISCAPVGTSATLVPICGGAETPYLGVCTITITWDESNQRSAAEQQTYTLTSQP